MSVANRTLQVEQGRAPIALALGALRDKANADGGDYLLTMGPLQFNRTLLVRMPVELGLYATPDASEPVHRGLVGRASEPQPGFYVRKLLGKTLLLTLRPRTLHGAVTIWACADGPRFRVAWPVLVIPDAQSLPGM